MYYKIILSNSYDWIQNELINELDCILHCWSYSLIKKTGLITTTFKNHNVMIYDFGCMISEEEKFKQRFRLVEFIKKHKTYIHFHFSLEQEQIIEKMLDLSNKSYGERIIDFYILHNYSKLEDIDSILSKYSNNMELLFCKLKKQYKSRLEIF